MSSFKSVQNHITAKKDRSCSALKRPNRDACWYRNRPTRF